MPPKRASSGSGPSRRKRAKTPSNEPPRSKRWAAVSASANADADYKTTWKNPDKWYSFVTICSPLEEEDEDGEDADSEGEEEEEDDDDGNDHDHDDDDEADIVEGGRPKCGKVDCLCFKPVSENPDHPWLVSQAGYRKYTTQHIHMSLRDPDNFDMCTFNDHAGYGALEVVQNLLLDYVEAADRGWKEQWAVCEGLALWLLSPASNIMTTIDDGECVNTTLCLVGRMFLDMLAQLDERSLVGDATDVKDVGTIMAIHLKVAAGVRDDGILEDEDNGKEGGKKFQPAHFDDAILSYANQRGVTLQGPEDVDELTANLDGNVELPKKGTTDPWGWNASLKQYEKKYTGLTGFMAKKETSGIGGDALDITTWSSSRRREANFERRDPLGRREMDAIKKGMVMQLG
ncbi:hypothetical protein AAE478_006106 [Parahypoxylon ruwenzoriense]